MKHPAQKTIEKNLNRRSPLVNDGIVFFNKIPMPTWIELSLIDVCNRTCSFCPKSNHDLAPDTHQKMNRTLIDKIANDLKKIKYQGSIALCGYGEPYLHNDITYIIEKLSKVASVELVTNGDPVSPKSLAATYKAGASRVLISLYDGEHQIKKFKNLIAKAKIPEDFVILRDRWYNKDANFGVKLTNRTGTINIGNQVKLGVHKTCYYPSYQFLIDWNGDVFLCPQDWQRRHAMGNVMQEDILSIWTGKIMAKYRKDTLCGKRKENPCKSCNADGTLLGQNHAKIWRSIYKI
jgi:radical SAM protein with 4Fe4S-binding SPASM domain